jgi:hypothetical protein
MLISPTVPLRCCWFPMIRVCRHNLRNLSLSIHIIMCQFLSQMLQLNTHQQSALFQNQTSLQFSDSLTRTVTSIVTNALTRALQSVNKRKRAFSIVKWNSFNVANRNKLCF